jgi:hypothetical protein
MDQLHRSPVIIPIDRSMRVQGIENMKRSLLSSKAKTSVFVSPFMSPASVKSKKTIVQETELDYAQAMHRAKIRGYLKEYVRDIERQVSLERRTRVYDRLSSMIDSFDQDVKVILRTSGLLMNLMSRLRNDHMDALNIHYDESKHLLRILARICKGDELNKEIFRKERGVFKLVEILKNARQVYFRDQSYQEILRSFLTVDPLAHKEYRDYGGIDELVSLLSHSRNQQDRHNVLSILFECVIVLNDDKPLAPEETQARDQDIEAFVACGGVLILIDLFSQGQDYLNELCGIRLAELCKYSNTVKDTVSNRELVSEIYF